MKTVRNVGVQSLYSRLQAGLSLIEVVLAALILSLGLLGVAQGQLQSLRGSEQAYFLSLADLKNDELAERLRSCGDQSSCIQEQYGFWTEEVRKDLPEGEGRLLGQGLDYQGDIRWISAYQKSRQARVLRLVFRP